MYWTTRRCDQDVIDIYVKGVTTFGVDQAERYHRELVATFELPAANPLMARERSEFDPPVRLHPHRSHMIVYVVEDEGVLMVRVLHGRQDWEQHLA